MKINKNNEIEVKFKIQIKDSTTKEDIKNYKELPNKEKEKLIMDEISDIKKDIYNKFYIKDVQNIKDLSINININTFNIHKKYKE